MSLKRGVKVKWPSLLNKNKVFRGVVRRVVGDRVIIDDQSGLTLRVVNIAIVVLDK